MKKQEYQRLVKAENIIYKYLESLGLTHLPVEVDVIPDQKMLEIMAYRSPAQISNWKFGRDYERLRTLHDSTPAGLPYEVVVHGNPARIFLMKSNTFPVNTTVMAHAIGHVIFFTMNKYWSQTRTDFLDIMGEANHRFLGYERKFGIHEIERTIDAGHALQHHSSPFDNETEDEKRERIYRQKRMQRSKEGRSEYSDLVQSSKPKTKLVEYADIELENERLKRELRLKSPVEPTEDFLRYIIDNSRILEDWQKDILEILREEGRFLWPVLRTQFMNEGFATVIHEKVMNHLFLTGVLKKEEHGSYNYSNARIKAEVETQLNPYLVGSSIWYDIEKRWDTGRHSEEYEKCESATEKENWDTKDMKGWEKVKEVLKAYHDWFFFQDFFTEELVDDLNLYLWQIEETMSTYDIKRTKHTAREVKENIINSFAHSRVPRIVIEDGDFRGGILLVHRHTGADLEIKYAVETMRHMRFLTNKDIYLETLVGDEGEKETVLLTVYEKNGEERVQVLKKLKGPNKGEEALDITDALKKAGGG